MKDNEKNRIEFLKAQYLQCNEHLRESDRKRDLLFGLYISLTVAYFSIFRDFSTDRGSIFVIVGLSLFGSCLGALFTLYRGWHGVYIIMIIIIQNIISNPEIKIDGAFIKKIDFHFQVSPSVELFMFLMLNAISAANTYFSISLLKNNYPVIFIISALWLAQIINHFYSMYRLDRLKNKSKLTTQYLWLLQGTIDH